MSLPLLFLCGVRNKTYLIALQSATNAETYFTCYRNLVADVGEITDVIPCY